MKSSFQKTIMNIPLTPQAPNVRRTFLRKLFPRLALGMFCLCVGTGLLLPAISRAGSHHRRLPGQLQADLRTFICGVRYLLTPEMPIETAPALTTGTNVALAQRPPAKTPALPELSCNQTSAPAGRLTNPPVQI
jgi:hypothetical protein